MPQNAFVHHILKQTAFEAAEQRDMVVPDWVFKKPKNPKKSIFESFMNILLFQKYIEQTNTNLF